MISESGGNFFVDKQLIVAFPRYQKSQLLPNSIDDVKVTGKIHSLPLLPPISIASEVQATLRTGDNFALRWVF